MTNLFLKIFNLSISATWLILAVLALRFLLKKTPKWVNVLLWGLVAVRLLCPFSLESALSLIPSTEVVSPQIMSDPTPTVQTGSAAVNAVINPVITETFAPEPAASANPLQILIPVAANLWLLGVLLLSAYSVLSYLRLRHRVRMAIRVRGNIYLSEFVTSPFVLGLLRPRIYLPYHMPEPDRTHVIAHERTHIRRRDHWWKPLGFLLLTLHWFNPFMWLAYILLCRDIEMACDEKVIQELGIDARADYSQALLHCAVTHRAIAACPIAFGEVGVKERVKNILNYRKPAFWVIFLCLLLTAILSVCFLTDPIQKSLTWQVTHQEGYTILSQEEKQINLIIEKDWLPEDAFTLKGHTFQEKEHIPYTTYASNTLYLKHVCYDDESREYLRFTFDFAPSREENGKLLLPYRVNTEDNTFSYGCAVVNGEVWGVSIEDTEGSNDFSRPDSAYTRGLGPDEEFTVLVKTSVYEESFKHIGFALSGFNLLTYEEGSPEPEEESDPPYQPLVGKTFHPQQLLYEDPRLSSTWQQFGIPLYAVTQDCYLLARDVIPTLPASADPAPWLEAGRMKTVELTSDNFDRYIHDSEGRKTAKALRKNTQQAWYCVTSGNDLYYLLRQENGDIYLALGAYDPEGESDWASDDSTIRFIVKLGISETTDWTFSISPFYITSTSALLRYHQVGAMTDASLSYGNDYTIEYLDGDTWKELPSLLPERVFTTEAYILETDSHTLESIDWSSDYGELPDGTYRLCKTITLHRGPGDSETRTFYVPFTVSSHSADDIFLTIEELAPTGMILHQTLFKDGDFLILEGDFRLETYQNGQWTYLEPTVEIEPIFDGTDRKIRTIYRSDDFRIELDWSNLYGHLPSGRYRILREYTIFESEPRIVTAAVEFTTTPAWGIEILIDRMSNNGITASLLLSDSLPAGEYFLTDARLQHKDFIDWVDILSHPTPEQDILDIASGISFLWDENKHILSEGQYRLGLTVTHRTPAGDEESYTFYEYFDPATYAWGVSMYATEVTPTSLEYETAQSKTLPEGTLTLKNPFTIQKRENNNWVDLEPQMGDPDMADSPVPFERGRGTIVWDGALGSLQNGTYRLVRHVTRHFPDGTTETRPVYAIFAIDSNPTGHVSLGTATAGSAQPSLESIPRDYTLEQATADGVVTFVDFNIHSNAELWQDFLHSTQNKTPATLRIMLYINIGDPESYAIDLYEVIKDGYPLKYYYDIRYDGTGYEVVGYNGGEKFEKHYKYLRHFTGEAPTENAAYDYYEEYILTDNLTATWEELFYSVASSQADAYIDHFTVYYSHFRYPDPVKAELLFDGQVFATVTDPVRVQQIHALFQEAIPAESPDPLPPQNVAIHFTDENGDVCVYPLTTQDDLYWIGDTCYDYGPDDARETLLRHFGITFTDPDILTELRTSGDSPRLTNALRLLQPQP